MSARTYTIAFRAPRGCPLAIIEDMARYDGAVIVSRTVDERCAPEHLREVEFEPKRKGFEPTMARWASFMVGAHKL